MKNEIMDGEQFKAAMDGNPTFEELEEMTEAKKRKSREENEARRKKEAEEERRRKEAEEQQEHENTSPENGWGYVSADDNLDPKDKNDKDDTDNNRFGDSDIPH